MYESYWSKFTFFTESYKTLRPGSRTEGPKDQKKLKFLDYINTNETSVCDFSILRHWVTKWSVVFLAYSFVVYSC